MGVVFLSQIPWSFSTEVVKWTAQTHEVTAILLLIPGYNGSGEAMMDERWRAFAEKHGLVLLAPTFKTTSEELRSGRGYGGIITRSRVAERRWRGCWSR